MKSYNKFMEWFWLVMGFLIIIVVTYMCITEEADRWAPYYALCLFTFGTYFLRRFMRKRMEKHIAFLEEQQRNGTTTGK